MWAFFIFHWLGILKNSNNVIIGFKLNYDILLLTLFKCKKFTSVFPREAWDLSVKKNCCFFLLKLERSYLQLGFGIGIIEWKFYERNLRLK
ncbi:hypothetical protein WN944_007529 [Citrus x changshan-huyou]|uniref:Uncharacterized protein n=1 Tax=Citrus x changshan-huyou TaxID=2935761 RepID=A0AAP0ML78_9ROSI